MAFDTDDARDDAAAPVYIAPEDMPADQPSTGEPDPTDPNAYVDPNDPNAIVDPLDPYAAVDPNDPNAYVDPNAAITDPNDPNYVDPNTDTQYYQSGTSNQLQNYMYS